MTTQDPRPVAFLGLSLVLGACFSPSVDEDEASSASASSTAASTGLGGTETDASTEGPGTSNPTDTTETGGPTASTTDGEDTDVPGTTNPSGPSESDTSAGSTDTGATEPFCGDSMINDGEECDDGLGGNGLDQACLPDCNLNVCGDSNLGPGEACDEGEDDNLLEPGACAPDCSGLIESREIIVSNSALAEDDGNFGPNPVATVDAMCPSGYRALVAIPSERQVASTPNQADAVVDWPLQPFTAYSNVDGEVVWITDDVPLLEFVTDCPKHYLLQSRNQTSLGGRT